MLTLLKLTARGCTTLKVAIHRSLGLCIYRCERDAPGRIGCDDVPHLPFARLCLAVGRHRDGLKDVIFSWHRLPRVTATKFVCFFLGELHPMASARSAAGEGFPKPV